MYKKLGAMLLLPFIAVAANSSSPEPEPGLYRVTVGVSGQDLAPGTVEESTEQCVTQEDLEADPFAALGEQAGMEGCSITSHDWGNGKINMQMECAIEGADASAVSRGTYNATGYELITTMTIRIGETSINMESVIRGERIGDC